MDLPFSLRQLFGGGLQAVLPSTWSDMSDIVPIPDNQELFNDPGLDLTAIVEILERVEKADEEAVEYLFKDLAEENDAVGEKMNRVEAVRVVTTDEAPGVSPAYPKYLLAGEQMVKPDQSPSTLPDQVKVLLFLLRLPEVNSDLLVSLNYPCKGKPLDQLRTEYALVEAAMMRIMQSIKINDMSLFGES
jgi:hypothetical protein